MKILLLVLSFALILSSESNASILFFTGSQDSVARAGNEMKANVAEGIVTADASDKLNASVTEQPIKDVSPGSKVTPVKDENSSFSETSKINSRKVAKRDAKIKYELRKRLVNKNAGKQKFIFHSRKTLKEQNRFQQKRRTQNEYRQNKRIK